MDKKAPKAFSEHIHINVSLVSIPTPFPFFPPLTCNFSSSEFSDERVFLCMIRRIQQKEERERKADGGKMKDFQSSLLYIYIYIYCDEELPLKLLPAMGRWLRKEGTKQTCFTTL